MATSTCASRASVAVPPARLFTYLADVRQLPSYLPRLTSATPTHDDKVQVSAHIDPTSPDKAFLLAESSNAPLVFILIGFALPPLAWFVGSLI